MPAEFEGFLQAGQSGRGSPPCATTEVPHTVGHLVPVGYGPGPREHGSEGASGSRTYAAILESRSPILGADADGWYRHVTLEGRAVSIEPDPECDDIDRLARHYTGDPFGTRDRPRVSARIEVDSAWHAWAGSGAWASTG